MTKFLLCFLALAGCGLSEKNHCATASDCLGGDVCHDGTCQPMSHDACGETSAACAPDATCADTSGGVACTCNPGFTGDGMTCSDVDECAASPSPCAVHAACTNGPSSFACACDADFTGDGTSYCVPSTFTKVATAGAFACGLADDGGIYCWGNNSVGSLGDGTTLSRTRPVQVGTTTDWIDVDARLAMACGLRTDHSMWCWGFGTSGQLGDGRAMSEFTPTQVVSDKPGLGWKAMALGRQQVCAIHDDGSAACWGQDRVTRRTVATPVAVDDRTDWTELAVGTVRCGLRGTPGHLYCWGASPSGDLGLGDTIVQDTPAQVGNDTWRHIAAGARNMCGIRSDGALLCWGNDIFLTTALQYGTTPQQIGTATDWQAVSLSVDSIVGLRGNGAAYAWGSNDFGQLGVPLTREILDPTAISGSVIRWSQISSGNAFSCGLADGQAYCWGAVGEGILGNGTTTTLPVPTRIGGDHWATVASSGAGRCGIRDDGALLCWGYDPSRGVGLGTIEPAWTPTRVGSATWTAIATSSSTSFNVATVATCALRDGKPYCWGDNHRGSLGIGSEVSPQLVPTAVNVPEGTRWTEIAVGEHTCAIQSTGALWCWGANDTGELGNGTTSTTPTTAPTTPLAGTWLHVAVTSYSSGALTCGIRTDRTLWCWGQDQPPTTTQHLVPTQVGSESSWASLSMAVANVCAVKTDGTRWCWGDNSGGQLGDGTTNSSPTPAQIGSAADWKNVALGDESCGVKTDGTLWCWGNAGLLGDASVVTYDANGFVNPTLSPTQIGRDTDWRAVTTNGTSCATKADGTLWCWGFDAAPIPGVTITPVAIR